MGQDLGEWGPCLANTVCNPWQRPAGKVGPPPGPRRKPQPRSDLACRWEEQVTSQPPQPLRSHVLLASQGQASGVLDPRPELSSLYISVRKHQAQVL